MIDYLLRGGSVVDGNAGPAIRADVAIEGDRIVAVGALADRAAKTVLDVRDRIVCPGFIDVHVHGDLALLADPTHEAAIFQGVTTYILGQDGCGFAPASPEIIHYMRTYTAGFTGHFPDLRCDWTNFEEYWDRFDNQVSLNVAYLVPNGTVRMAVMGLERRAASATEIQRMQSLVRELIDQGAVGLSTGLDYLPSLYADTAEIAALCAPLVSVDGVYVTHMRDLSPRGITDQAMDEIFAIGERAGVRLHISHFGARAEAHLKRVDLARKMDYDITFETYPYLAGMTLLAMVGLPIDIQDGGPEATLARLDDPAVRQRVHDWWHDGHLNPDNLHLAGTATPRFRDLEGHTLTEAARLAGQDIADLCRDILIENRLAANVVAFDVRRRESDLIACMTHPAQMGGSDGIYWGSRPHPRGWGCFARFLGRYARELSAWTFEEAIHHLSARAADRFQLKGRGRIVPGMFADVVVLDPVHIQDRSTYPCPKRLAEGVDHVFVNGRHTLRSGQHTGATAGRALRRAKE